MSKNYGLPYMGSKNRIAKELITEIIWNEPNAEIFVDLFAGGCAMAHTALLSGKFKKVIANDINEMPKLFKDAIKGKYRDETRWISRDEFHKLKDTDMYIKSCWSFGNDGKTYLYGEHLEPYKKAYHYARVLGDFSLFNQFAPYIEQENGGNLRKCIKANYERIKKDYMHWFCSFHSQLEYSRDEVESMLKATQADYDTEAEKIRQYLRNALNQSGKTQADIDRYLNNNMAGHYFGKSQWLLPTKENYEKLQEILPLEKPYTEISKIIIGIRYKLQNLQNLQNLQSLESLQRLQRLERLERLENLSNILEISQGSYKDFKLPKADECVIYCDIPYKGTQTYNHDGEKVEFDYEAFYNWVRDKAKQGYKVYISEYQMPSDFEEILAIDTNSRLNDKSPKKVKEKLFKYEN